MERFLCLALLLALLLATVSCPAFAETDGVVIENNESIGSDILLADGIDLEDLLQEGRFAMLTAAKHFDEGRNVKFSTYAYDVM